MKCHLPFLALAAFFAATSCATSAAGADGPGGNGAAATVTPVAEVRLPDSRQWTLRATGSGREYAIFLAVPEGPAPEGGYASIYVLDGNAMFLTTAEAVRAYARRRDIGREARALVVGIGYPPDVNILEARTFDLTPAVEEPRVRGAVGGAEAFFAFIENDLKPRIAREFSVNPRQQALIGHSYGGLFTLDMLTRHPEAFQTWVGMSSSFWFGKHELSDRIARFAQARANQPTPLRVLLTVGEFEQRPSAREWVRNPGRAGKLARDLAERGQISRAEQAVRELAGIPALMVDYRLFAGEDHGSVIPAAIGRAVDFIFAGPRSIPSVPSGKEYMAMGAEGRYHLRMQVRALPDPVRIPWLNGLKAALGADLDEAARKSLHDEREEMDQRFGSVPHAINAD